MNARAASLLALVALLAPGPAPAAEPAGAPAADAAPPPAAGEVLFADDFEDGLSPDWARSAGIEAVPEDPEQPDGNRVARLAAGGLSLAAAPAAPAGAGADRPRRGRADAWDDYEFTFRFRLGSLPEPALKGLSYYQMNDGQLWAATRPLVRFAWRVDPREEAPGACWDVRLVSCFGDARGDYVWMEGPRVHGYGRPYENRFGTPHWLGEGVESGPGTFPMDTAWHTVRVRVEGARHGVWIDGRVFRRGVDGRIRHGGVALETQWGEVAPSHLDIDDVLVRRISRAP